VLRMQLERLGATAPCSQQLRDQIPRVLHVAVTVVAEPEVAARPRHLCTVPQLL
jgi:hypothetical protein